MIVPGLVLTLVACLSSPLTNFELDSSPKETIVGHDFVSNTDIVREEGLTEYAIGSRILEPFFPEGGGDAVPNSIFGNDDRVFIDDDQYSDFPYRTICLIYITYDFNDDGIRETTRVGTGCLVGPDVVVTAAHLVYDAQHSDWGYCTVMPGGHFDDNNNLVTPYGSYQVTFTWKGNNATTNDSNDDWALLRIEEKVGNEIGYLGVGSSLISVGTNVRLYGYHSDVPNRLAYGPGEVTALYPYKFYHNCDALSGSSGGPITFGTVIVVGIHSGGVNSYNDVACRITDTLVSYIEGMIEEANQ